MTLQHFQFAGQHADEKILYVSRMHPIAFIKNILLISLTASILIVFFAYFGQNETIGMNIPQRFLIGIIGAILLAWLFALWWAQTVYNRTYFVITDRRLVKLGYHSPFTSYQSSANLAEIEDAAATTRSLIEQLFGIGTFYARSAPAGERDFWFEHLPFHKDIHNYVMKMLYTLKHDANPAETLKNFRPFIPRKHGERY